MTTVLVTGSAGFIGSHLCPALARPITTLDKVSPADYLADIRDFRRVESIAAQVQPESVIHLAAVCEVVTPWAETGDLLATNVDGTYNVLRAFAPRQFLFASSSSVYGNGVPPETTPSARSISPLSAYGTSKATGETLCRFAAHEYNGAAVAFRLANVVGERCRGLIRYLLDHACLFPDGSEPVRLRGAGRLVRDYVPVSWVVKAFQTALDRQWDNGLHVFNVSSGIPLTNGQVFEIVSAALARRGFSIRAHWGPSAAFGEVEHVLLDPESLVRGLGIEPPKEAEIVAAFEAAVAERLGQRAEFAISK